MSEQRGDVFPAIAERGQLEMNYVQAVVQILAEAALADQRQELNVGCSNDADINFELFRAAEAHEFALLNDAEKFGLRFGADGGDFVEENRALIGDLEEPFFGSDGASESALHVPE